MKIIKLSASWCGPCKVLDATMKKILSKDEYKDIEFIEYDVEKDEEGQEMAASEGIRGVPTMFFYDDEGNQFFKMVGNAPQADIEKVISTKSEKKEDKEAKEEK